MNKEQIDSLDNALFSVTVEFKGKRLTYDVKEEIAITDLGTDLMEQPMKYIFWARLAKNASIAYKRIVEYAYPSWLAVANVVAREILALNGDKITVDAVADTVKWLFSDTVKKDKKLRKEYMDKVLTSIKKEPLVSYIQDIFSVEDDNGFNTWAEWQDAIYEAQEYRDMLATVERGFEQRLSMLQSLRALSSSDYLSENEWLQEAVAKKIRSSKWIKEKEKNENGNAY